MTAVARHLAFEENTKVLGYLCPALNRRESAEGEAQRKREHDVVATAERRCASVPERTPTRSSAPPPASSCGG
ncbi:hypothetical protein GCM10010149_65280 [Nonomuraea roseoviolacea subsp. roseoviolacea]